MPEDFAAHRPQAPWPVAVPQLVPQLSLPSLLDGCEAAYAAWPAGQRPGLRAHLAADLRGPRLGSAHAIELLLLQLLRTAGTLTQAPAIDLYLDTVETQPHRVRFKLRLEAALPLSLASTLDHHAVLRGPLELDLALLEQLLRPLDGRLAVARPSADVQWLWFELPLPPAPRAPAAAVDAAQPVSCRVLLVEDNEVNAELTTWMLHGGGTEVTVARNGAQALTLALQQRFDVVLMDMFLPDTDGLVVARKIARLLGADAPPILAFTANDDRQDRELCLEAGMVDVLIKPVTQQVLRQAVDDWAQWSRRHGRPGPGARET